MKHRLLFYTHDSFGLGHFRRSLTVASYLARHIDGLSILMLTGLDSAASFEAPPGVDFVKLPGIWKSGADTYRSRHLRVSFTRVRRLREKLILAVARAFKPGMVVVDTVPRGVDGELLSMLRYLRRHEPAVRVALTLRDVLDSPEHIVPVWRELGVYDALQRFYDEVWVAGCQPVFDPVAMYELPSSLHGRVKFCGYVVRSSAADDVAVLRQELRLGDAPLVVASCGGGGDGYPLLDAYADVAGGLARDGVCSAVFLGPDLPAAQRRTLKQRLLPLSERVSTYDFRPDLVAFLQLASVSVSMAGYNTASEIVAQGTPAVVVPRVTPRVEQLLRAQAFAARGLLRVVRPERLNPETLQAEVRAALATPRGCERTLPDELDFAGLTRIARRVRKHLGIAEPEGRNAA